MRIREVEEELVGVDGVHHRIAVSWRSTVERSDVRDGGAGGASRRRQQPLSIGLGLGTVGKLAAVNLVSRAVVPTSPLLHCATGAHQPVIGLDSPDQGARSRTRLTFGLNQWRSI
jgi:hypothetical protein